MKKETITKFYLTYRFYIFPVIVVLLSLFLVIFAIYPQTVRLIDDQKKTGELLNRSNLLTVKVQALENYNGEDLSQKVKIALTALPTDKDFANILGVLQQLTSQSGFTVTSITLGNTSSKVGNVDSYDVKIDMKGAKVLLPVLLSSLEKSPRLVRVKGMDLLIDNASQGVNLSLSLGVLYASAPQNFGTPDSPLPSLSQQDEATINSLVQIPQKVSTTSAVVSQRGKANPFE